MFGNDNTPLGPLTGVSPQRAYLWDVILPAAGGTSEEAFQAAEMCRSVDFGNGVSMKPSETKEGAFTTFASGPLAVGVVTMKFLADEESDAVLPYFQAWSSRIASGRSVYAPKAFYAFEVGVMQYSTDGFQSGYVHLINAFPIKIGKSTLKHEGEDLVTWDVIFSVDRAVFE